ncbi:MAG TPA: site-specific integrase [Nitrospiraceae bacterium]|jgi:integrase|nr:site-specific integrase [Nitrospiraceae bacterium]
MTIGEFLVLYEQNHVVNLKSRRNLSRRLQRYVTPFAALALGDLTRMQVIAWHQEIGRTRGHSVANQALSELHAMYAKAQDWELYDGRNPAHRIKKFPKQSRERFVQSHEMPRLLQALSEEKVHVETFFLCLLLTGCRLGELRAAQWKDFDLAQGLWHKPMTKNGTRHTIPLAEILIPRLQHLPRPTIWVFPSRPNGKNGGQGGQRCRTAVRWMWERIRRRAGLPDVTIHDLRRTAASWLAINGDSLPIISQMLNHKSLACTQVYARLSVEPVRVALNEQATRMLGLGPVVMPSQPPQTPSWAPSRDEREAWPG